MTLALQPPYFASSFSVAASSTESSALAGSLLDLSTWTGGHVFVVSTPAERSAVAQQIVAELRHQYLLGYSPSRVRTILHEARRRGLLSPAMQGRAGGSLTEKGKQACEVVSRLYQRQLKSIETVGEVGRDDVQSLNRALVRLERFWSDQIRYRL